LAEELYDLDNDPFELNNLSNNPDYADKLKNLSNTLDKWLDEIDDLGRIPEKELIKIITDEN
jgi:N-sulfoglucosamine sulfohydrolase